MKIVTYGWILSMSYDTKLRKFASGFVGGCKKREC